MAWRQGHGSTGGKNKLPRIEVLPLDELGKPLYSKLRTGGAMKIKLARGLTLKLPPKAWKPYLEQAEHFRRHQAREIARQSGGRCGAGPSSMVATAALQLAASRYIMDKGMEEDDMSLVKMASGIANDSRQNLLAAFELAHREAYAMRQHEISDPHRMLAEALVETLPTSDDLEHTLSNDPAPLPPDPDLPKQ